MFYIIASPRPSGGHGGFSISIVCYDETLERYPWLEPPVDIKPGEYGKCGWEDEYSALPETMKSSEGSPSSSSLSENLQQMFLEEVPEFYVALDEKTFLSARVNRRTNWLEMTAIDDEDGKGDISYSTEDGIVALIGDAAHAMTPSMGEGCNTALESAVKLVDGISSIMERKGESECSGDTLSEGFSRYGSDRPKECIPIQLASAARNVLRKAVLNTTPTSKDVFLHPKTS